MNRIFESESVLDIAPARPLLNNDRLPINKEGLFMLFALLALKRQRTAFRLQTVLELNIFNRPILIEYDLFGCYHFDLDPILVT